MGAAKRTLDSEDRSGRIGQEGKAGERSAKVVPPKWPHRPPPLTAGPGFGRKLPGRAGEMGPFQSGPEEDGGAMEAGSGRGALAGRVGGGGPPRSPGGRMKKKGFNGGRRV